MLGGFIVGSLLAAGERRGRRRRDLDTFATHVDEAPGWFLGAAYAVLAAIGITAGVLARQRVARA